jgi:hydrogenase maturation factor
VRLACTIEVVVVTPIFFPGGDIGRLAMNGARLLYVSAVFGSALV